MRYVSACGTLTLVASVVAVTSVVVYRLEGHATGLGDHVSNANNVPERVQDIRMETLFPPWMVTCQVYTESLTSLTSVGDLLGNRSSPVVSAPEGFLLPQAADLSLAQPEAGPSFSGDLAGGLFPTIPLTPVPAAASRHGGESDAVGGPLGTPNLSREGPFDIHQDNPCSTASPQLLQDTQGCPFRMTSYDEGTDSPNFAPAYGVQVHDPRLLEYIGAPKSARLTSRSPEYWVHHMGREKALSAALQIQHDAGLILSNFQVLQQLVTALNRTLSDVL